MLDSLFVQGSWEILHHREWRAYPVLKPKEVGDTAGRMSQGFAPKVSGGRLWTKTVLVIVPPSP